MMTYKEFKNALTTELNTKLGTGGNAQPGTDTIMGCLMETVTVTIISTGQKYSANTDKLYELYRKGMNVTSIAALLLQSVKSLQINEDVAPDSIVYCLVNAESNKEMLQDTPHIPFYDMAILFSSIIRDDEQQRNFMILSEALMKEHNFTLSQLSDLAHQNTFRMFPSRAELLPLYLMSRVMQDDKATLDDYMEVAYASYESRKRPPMLRVSTLITVMVQLPCWIRLIWTTLQRPLTATCCCCPVPSGSSLSLHGRRIPIYQNWSNPQRKSSPWERNLSSPDTSSATTKIRRNWN